MIRGRERRKNGSKKRRVEEKRGKNPNKPRSGLAEQKALHPKYTNYHALKAPQDHMYAVTAKNLFKKPKEIRDNGTRMLGKIP